MIKTLTDFRLRLTMTGISACREAKFGGDLGLLDKAKFVDALPEAIDAIAESELSEGLCKFFGAGVEGIEWRVNAGLWSTNADWGIRGLARRGDFDAWRRQPHWNQVFATVEPASKRLGPEFLVNSVATVRGYTGDVRQGLMAPDGSVCWVPWPEVGIWVFVARNEVPNDIWLAQKMRKSA